MREGCRHTVSTLEAVKKISHELCHDKGYREGWRSNIAMAYIDSEIFYKQMTGKKQFNNEEKHIIANKAAENFLRLLDSDYFENQTLGSSDNKVAL